MRTFSGRVLLISTLALLLLSGGLVAAQGSAQSPAQGQEPQPGKVAAVTPLAGPTDPAELEAFIDGVMAAQMAARRIPAATIAVVKDGKLFFAKGYGFADRAKRIPVEPDKTLFRPGSVSKLFTWTAVMQLYERGQLDLNADVNKYLKKFKIPATYPHPITMKNLLTHTPGFEDGGWGYLMVKKASELMPLSRSLALHIPERVRPPGTWSSYSNYGAALAGLIVENISGMPFPEYIKKNIFDPLGMEHSTFVEPLPKNLAPDMAVGYKRKNGLYVPESFEFIGNFGPAGSLSSTATDMAKFMIAQLQLGRFGDHRILEEKTARLMHSRLYAPDPRLPGMDYGFYQSDVYGEHIIGHGGDTTLFHSELALLPKYNVGLFVSYVTHGGHARSTLIDAFVKRYFPTKDTGPLEPPAKPPKGFFKNAQKFAGKYRFTRHNWSDIEKVLALPEVLTVAVTKKGTLSVTIPGLSDEPLQWVQVGPTLFRQIGGPLSLGFIENPSGRVTHMVLSNLPFMPTYRIPWYTDPTLNYALVGLALLLCLTILVSAFRHRKARRGDPLPARWAVRLSVLVSVLTLVFVVAVVIIVKSAGDNLFFGFPPTLTAALILPIITSILTLGVAVLAVLGWLKGYWTRFQRVHYTLFALFAVGLVWFYWFWNVLGIQYG